MLIKKLIISITFIILVASIIVRCTNNDDYQIEHEVDKLLHPLVQEDLISGSILIAKEGNIIFSKGYGLADREQDIQNKPKTIFRIGSITKSFTATAILQLCERNLLSLDDTIDKYLSGYPKGNIITIHHLLSHTSGIKNFIYLPDYLKKSVFPHSPEELINWFKDEPLLFKPGTGFHYSNSNYVILTYIIEKVSGKSYSEFLQQNIFAPLEMNETGVDRNGLILKNRAEGYVRVECDDVSKAIYQSLTFGLGHGALYSNVLDLYKWDRALRTNRLLSKSSLLIMFTPNTELYGYGWSIGTEYDRKVIFHGGAISGYISMIKRFVDDDILIVSLCNMETLLEQEISKRLTAIALSESWEPVFKSNLSDYELGVFSKWEGNYKVEQDYYLKIEIENNKIYVEETGYPQYEARYITENKLFVKEMNAIVIFEKDVKTKETKAIIFQGLLKWFGTRNEN